MRMINATLVTPVHFTGFEKQETSNGSEYLFYGSWKSAARVTPEAQVPLTPESIFRMTPIKS